MKSFFYIGINLFILICFSNCYEDKGNYDYDWVSNASVNNFLSSYTYQVGDSLLLQPEIKFGVPGEGVYYVNKEDIFSNDEYAYYWIAKRYDEDWGGITEDTIGRERNLAYKVDLAPEEYMVEYQICNLTHNIKWISKFTLKVTLSIAEGWLLLEDKEGSAELSIYGPIPGKDSMILVKNMLASSGIPASDLRGPRQVFATYQNSVGSGVWILTDHFTGYLDVKAGHQWKPRQVIKNHLVERPDENFVFTKMFNLMFNTVFGLTGNEIRLSRYPAMLFTADLVPSGEKSFEIAPYIATVGFEMQTRQALAFDVTHQVFKLLDIAGSFNWTEADQNFPQGHNLKFMEVTGEVGSQKIYCLTTKDNGVYQTIASSATQIETPTKLLSTSEKFLNAEQCVYHKFFNLPYYLYEGKLYVNRSAGDDREVEYYKEIKPEENEGEEGKEDEEEEIEMEKVPAELEGEIVYINAIIFTDLYMSGNEHRQIFMNYLVVSTEMPDGTGRVYFLTPEQGNAQRLVISDSVATDHKVISIDYQRPGI